MNSAHIALVGSETARQRSRHRILRFVRALALSGGALIVCRVKFLDLRKIRAQMVSLGPLISLLSLLLFPSWAHAWEAGGFSTPESALSDPETRFIYVSNINGSPTAEDNNGFISKLSPEGEMVELEFIKGTRGSPLHAPKGLAIRGKTLYVTDIRWVRAYDLGSGEHLLSLDLSGLGATFLNDLAFDSEGNLFASDTDADSVFKIEAGGGHRVSLLLRDHRLKGPNGLLFLPEGRRLLCVTWGGEILQLAPGPLRSLLKEGFKNLDGLDHDGRGNLYFSDFTAGKVYRLRGDGVVETLLSGLRNPADISVDRRGGQLLVPEFSGHTLRGFPLR